MAAAYRKVVDFNSLHLNYSIYLDILVYAYNKLFLSLLNRYWEQSRLVLSFKTVKQFELLRFLHKLLVRKTSSVLTIHVIINVRKIDIICPRKVLIWDLVNFSIVP